MGYKAWVGGKSAWVQTDFGTKRGFGKHVGTDGGGNSQESDSKRKYRFLSKDGKIYESYSKESARILAGPGAVQISVNAKRRRKTDKG